MPASHVVPRYGPRGDSSECEGSARMSIFSYRQYLFGSPHQYHREPMINTEQILGATRIPPLRVARSQSTAKPIRFH